MAYKYSNPCVFQVPIKLEIPIVLDLAVGAKPQCFTKYEEMGIEENGAATESPQAVTTYGGLHNSEGVTKRPVSFTGSKFEQIVVQKDKPAIGDPGPSKKMLPKIYQNNLKSQLTRAKYLLFSLLVRALQSLKNVRLETLTASLPLPIIFESSRKKLQRFMVIKEGSRSVS